LEVTLGPEVADGQPENGQLVELGDDALFEGQQAGQVVQLGVETFSVPLAGVALRRVLHRRFDTAYTTNANNTISYFSLGKPEKA
jgi:hypothetical protein